MKMLAMVLAGAGLLLAGPAQLRADLIAHRGWEGCRVLDNGSTRVIIAPTIGARIVEFSYNGENVLLVDHDFDGRILPEGYTEMPFDGSQPDTLEPHGGSQLAEVWMGEYKVSTATALSVKCQSKDNTIFNLRCEMEFTLDALKPVLTIKRRIINTTDVSASSFSNRGLPPRQWASWDRIRLAAGAIGVSPVNPKGYFGATAWGTRLEKKFAPGPADVSNPQVVNGLLILRPSPPDAPDFKTVALDATDKWTGAIVRGLLFTINYPVSTKDEYPWNYGINSIFRTTDKGLTLEPCSHYFKLRPSDFALWTTTWTLATFGEVPATNEAIAAKVSEIATHKEPKKSRSR